MSGRIREQDVAEVRSRINVADVIGEHVTLRPAGGGSLKGLCPFHDERTPSFHVTPSRGFYHCFGCGEGGDAIDFLRRVDGLSFAEAVERLAVRAGVELHYENSGAGPRAPQGQRTRLTAANGAAAEFFAASLATPEAEPARRFLAERGFDDAAVQRFGVGYAPTGWDTVVRQLAARGFSTAEVLLAGIAREGRQGRPVDRFPGRLVWPIRDVAGDVVGFGARRIAEGDTGPKYLNTPETPLYRKGQVLYGLYEAKREIARTERAVVVEGYTDVMACHLAGVGTAVATCGTAFGEDHVKILRRILYDTRFDRSEMIFVFDGDSAGQQAALRSFQEEQTFVTQTFVAVAPDGMDPCELRLARGDEAVRALVESRVGLFEFALRQVVRAHDVDRPEGRVAALAEAAPVVARIKDVSLRPEYVRRLAGLLGTEVEQVQAAVAREGPRTGRGRGQAGGSPGTSRRGSPAVTTLSRGDAERGAAAWSGSTPSGSSPSGSRSGTPPSGSRSGMPSSGATPSSRSPGFGSTSSGTASSGTTSSGTASSGTTSSGTASSGTTSSGTASSASSPAPESLSPRPAVPGAEATAAGATRADGTSAAAERVPVPHPRDPANLVARELLKVALQEPTSLGSGFDELPDDAILAPAYRWVRDAVRAAGGCARGAQIARVDEWTRLVRDRCPDDGVRSLVTELVVEPLLASDGEGSGHPRYGASLLARAEEACVVRQIAELRSRLQRLDPVAEADAATDVLGALMALETRRRTLREAL